MRLLIKIIETAAHSATNGEATKMAKPKPITTANQIDRAITEAVKKGKTVSVPIAGFKGLEIRIRPSGSGRGATTTFRHRYKMPYVDKRPYMTIGTYPYTTLAQARVKHTENMVLLDQMIDPIVQRDDDHKAKVQELTNGFADVAQQWIDKESDGMSRQTLLGWNRAVKSGIEAWGKDIPIKNITRSMILKLCEDVSKNTPATAKRMANIYKRIFSYALMRELVDVNQAAEIARQLKTNKVVHQPAIINPIPFGKLLRDIDAMPHIHERTALQLIALLFVRVGDMSAAKWSDIDFNAAQWTLRPEKSGSRTDMVDELIIPLPKQAIALLKEQYEHTGSYQDVFHNQKRVRRNARHLNSANLSRKLGLINDGRYKGVHVPHGFRASALTMLQEQLGYPNYLADAALGHAVKDTNGAAYNRATFIVERTEMMQAYADYLDKLKTGNTIIHASFKAKAQKLG